MAGILLIYILGIYFLLTKMMQLEDEAVVGVKKTHKELSETTHSSNEKAIQYVASNMIKETKPGMDTETTGWIKRAECKSNIFPDRGKCRKYAGTCKERIGRRASGRQSYVSPCRNHTCTG